MTDSTGAGFCAAGAALVALLFPLLGGFDRIERQLSEAAHETPSLTHHPNATVTFRGRDAYLQISPAAGRSVQDQSTSGTPNPSLNSSLEYSAEAIAAEIADIPGVRVVHIRTAPADTPPTPAASTEPDPPIEPAPAAPPTPTEQTAQEAQTDPPLPPSAVVPPAPSPDADGSSGGEADDVDASPSTTAEGAAQVEAAQAALDALLSEEPIEYIVGANRPTLPSRPTVTRIADILLTYPSVTIEITGHADGLGDPSFNQLLSEFRAHWIRDELITAGIPPERINAAGRGEQEPIDSNDTRTGRHQNRRVEFRVKAPR